MLAGEGLSFPIRVSFELDMWKVKVNREHLQGLVRLLEERKATDSHA